MVKLFRTELTATGRPILLHGEIERGMLDKVDIFFYGAAGGVDELPSDEYRGGYVVVTNYRLIWIRGNCADSPKKTPAAAAAAGVPCHLPLSAVSDAEHKGGMLVKAARIKLAVRIDGASYPTADPRSVACVAPLKLVCRGPNPETLHSQLMAALERRAWAAAPPGLLQQLFPVPALPPLAGGVEAGRVAARPLGARQQGEAAGAGGSFQPDWASVEGLCVIGYPRLHAVNAVVATRNAGVQQAVEWLLDNEGSPALDQPSPYLAASSSASGNASSSGAGTAAPAFGAVQSPAGAAGSSFANPLLAGLRQQQQQQPAAPSSPQRPVQPVHSSSGSGLYSTGSGGTPAVLQAAPLRGGGVTAILQRVQDQVDATETTMDQAFSDLSQLMRKAEEMVQLAQYFRERVAARKEGAASDGEEELDAETALDLINLGIVSPVTRDTAGSLYFQELARQLADFLVAPMARAGGMMPLPDVYCLCNRARGTELISPDDLASAVNLFPQIRAPFALREFASGVKVVQSVSHSDEAICRRIAELVAPQPARASTAAAAGAAGAAGAGTQGAGGASSAAMAEGEAALLATLGPSLTRVEVAVSLGVPVAIAGEHLMMAEARGVVCRDEGPEGLRYWRNFFPDFADSSAAA